MHRRNEAAGAVSIERRNLETKVCIHTNHDNAAVQREALSLGADLFLVKPADKECLVRFFLSNIGVGATKKA